MPDAIHAVCPKCLAVNRVLTGRLDSGPVCGKCRAPILDPHPVQLTAANFDTFLAKSDLPVLLDFWAPWCAPCRSMAPAFSAAAAQLEPHFRLAKLDTESAPEIAGRFGIRSIPTLILFRHGREIARQSGALDSASIVRWVRSQH